MIFKNWLLFFFPVSMYTIALQPFSLKDNLFLHFFKKNIDLALWFTLADSMLQKKVTFY